MTKTLSSLLLLCHAELAEASLSFNPLFLMVFFGKPLFAVLFFCDAKLHLCSLEKALRASLQMGEGAFGLQIFRPYGAASVARCSLFVKATSPPPLS
jgi:hypothetical protein